MEDQEFINQLAEKLSKLGTVRPLGFHYLHPYGTVPADSIICNGATYSRALYKDFFDYITTQGWVKTEAEWQEIATRDNGFCPFYSEGDGSTNFRTPRFAPYQQIAVASVNAGTYHAAGLPNITGVYSPRDTVGATNSTGKASGAFYNSTKVGSNLQISSVSGDNSYQIGFDASRSNAIYGRSTTVQPESHEWMICVVVAGQATNLGSVDMADVLTTVAQVQAQVDELSGVAGDVTKLKRFFNGTFTKTLLAGGPLQSDWIGRGSITLAKPWDNFDALLIYSGTDYSDSYLNSTLIYKWQLSELFAIAKTSGKNYVQIWNNVAGHFWGVKVSSSTSIAFNDPDEDSGLQAIYGLKC